METSSDSNKKDRRKMIYWVAGALSVLTFWKYMPSPKKEEKPVKMLTEDGQLVEVDMKHLKGKRSRLRSEEFYSWVKRKKT
jgi:hypothetical protein